MAATDTAAPAPRAGDVAPLLPGDTWLGVLGGGQLGRMFVHTAQALGYRVLVLDPDAASPAGAAADAHLRAAYDDAAALAEMERRCAAVSTEFENVPADALRRLAAGGRCRVAPPADAVQACQHRAREKQVFVDAGVPCAPHAPVERAADLAAPPLARLLPGILKTSSLGYDGKGQVTVVSAAELEPAWAGLGRVACVLEQRLPLAREVSVIVARGADGVSVTLPLQQNLHRDGILAVTEAPAPDVPADLAAAALAHARRLAESMRYVGVLCVEFFVLADGTLVANEMAPRPHNSGHYSIDACDVSQFELQVRTLAGLPLVAPRLHSPAVMLNLLGDLWFAPGPTAPAAPQATTPQATAAADAPRTPPWHDVLALPGVHLHLYGKAEPRRGRKMGHLTVTAADAATARERAREVARRLGLPPF